MSKKKNNGKSNEEDSVNHVVDERYSLQPYDGLLMATEDLFNRYLLPSMNPVSLEEIKGASTLLREARGILDSRRRNEVALRGKVADDAKHDFELNASGPFSVFQGGK